MSFKKIAPARKVGTIRYAVRDILKVADEAKRSGREMVYLNIGDPNIFDFVTPPWILEDIIRAMKDGKNGYAASEGLPEACAAIRSEAESRGLRNIQSVFLASGCSEGIEIALSALCNPGENILTPSPGYPLYTALVAKLGLETNPYFLNEDDGWQPDVDDLESRINDQTRAIVIINPNNPTGSVCSRRTLERIVDVARRHNLLIVADEIYGRLTLDGLEHIPLATIDPEIPMVTFDGLSKAYLGPGLRIGWGILSGQAAWVEDYKNAVLQLLRARISANHPEQYAIAGALRRNDHLPAVLEKITRRRDLTVSRLNAIPGIHCVAPKGAFYAFPRLLDVPAEREETFVADMIRATGVVVVHGGGFGQRPGTSHFRVVYLPQEAILEKAYTRIAEFMATTATSGAQGAK